MAKVKYKKKKAEKKGSELLESPEALAARLSKTEQYLEKNKKIVLIAIGTLAVIVSGFFLGRYYLNNQNNQAQIEMFQAIYYFESDSLDLALNGDGNNYGFLDIIDNYGFSKAANLAHFYVGASYLKKGEFENAIDYLLDFSADDIVVQARAYALIGDAYMELNDFRTASEYYSKAADYKPNEYLSPIYLEKAAQAYERLMEYESASDCFETIIKEYPESSEYQNARKHKARLDGLASK
jgi:tetratricopeptide (TPR) repeat protein